MIRPTAVNSQRDARTTQQHQSTELGRTSDEAWGAREPAQNLGVSPPPSPLLAAAGQPPAPVPLPQSGAPGARNYLGIILSPAPTRPSSPAPPSALPPVKPSSFQLAASRDTPSEAVVAAEAAAAGKTGGTFNADSAGKEASSALTFEILGRDTPAWLVRDVEQLMKESFDEWPATLLEYRAAATARSSR